MKRFGELLIHIIFGMGLIFMGLQILTEGGSYHGYPLPRVAGLVQAICGVIWLLCMPKKK
jgi:hypothetical protein